MNDRSLRGIEQATISSQFKHAFKVSQRMQVQVSVIKGGYSLSETITDDGDDIGDGGAPLRAAR